MQIASDALKWEISADSIRVRFPLDVSIRNALVIDQKKDTMIVAQKFDAIVHALPLLEKRISVERATLSHGKYYMLSKDSTMRLRVRVDTCSITDTYVDLAQNMVKANRGYLNGGDVRLYFDPYKASKGKSDSIKSPGWRVDARELTVKNIHYNMSMRPIIDEIDAQIGIATLREGKVDTERCFVKADYLSVDGVDASYYTPTAEWLASYVAPKKILTKWDSIPSPDWTVSGKRVELRHANALYAVRNAKPRQGLDMDYIQGFDMGFTVDDFYNKAMAVRVPIKELYARERCGVRINSLSGVFEMDSLNMSVENAQALTDHSSIKINSARTQMEMFLDRSKRERAQFKVDGVAHVAKADIDMLFPALREYTQYLGMHSTVGVQADMNGTLCHIDLGYGDVSISDCGHLSMRGDLSNVVTPLSMSGHLEIKGMMSNLNRFKSLILNKEMQQSLNIPTLECEGSVNFNGKQYATLMQVQTAGGEIRLDGSIDLNNEIYSADITLEDVDLKQILGSGQFGNTSLKLRADGTHFNPLSIGGRLNADIEIGQTMIGDYTYRDIVAGGSIQDNHLTFDINSDNPYLSLLANGDGEIKGSAYDFSLNTDIKELNLKELGAVNVPCKVQGSFLSSGTFDVTKDYYNLSASIDNLNALYDNSDLSTNRIRLDLLSQNDSTNIKLNERDLSMTFNSGFSLRSFTSHLANIGEEFSRQMQTKRYNYEELNKTIPGFELQLQAQEDNMLARYLKGQNYGFRSLDIKLAKDSILHGHSIALGVKKADMCIDTLALDLSQEENYLSYNLHCSMLDGKYDGFAYTDISGLYGDDFVTAMAKVRNRESKIRYLLGVDCTMMDSNQARVTFFPDKPVIAFEQWQFHKNRNFFVYTFNPKHLSANFNLVNEDASIQLVTSDGTDGNERGLNLFIDNLNLEKWTTISPFVPNISGLLYVKSNLNKTEDVLCLDGNVAIRDFVYEKQYIGNMAAGFDIDYNKEASENRVDASVYFNGYKSLSANGHLEDQSANLPLAVNLNLDHFPLSTVNAVVFKDGFIALDGYMKGDITLGKTDGKYILNGYLEPDSARFSLPSFGSYLNISSDKITVKDNLFSFNNVNIRGERGDAATLKGNFDMRNFNNIYLNFALKGSNVNIINSKRKHKDQIFGQGYADIEATAKGRLSLMDVNVKMSVLENTSATYVMPEDVATLADNNATKEMIKFVQFNDTIAHDSIPHQSETFNMNFNADINIRSGAEMTVYLNRSGKNRAYTKPTGHLYYTLDNLGNSKMTGRLDLSDGYARYSLPIVGEKQFTLANSYINFLSDITDPYLNINATCKQSAMVILDSSSPQRVEFDIKANITNKLSQMNIQLDLDANNSTLQSELQGLSLSQRQSKAIGLMLYNTYNSDNNSTTETDTNNLLYGVLASQISNLTSKFVSGVDISFGINQYENSTTNTSSMNYSYKISKSILNNRLKMSIGGSYDTSLAQTQVAQSLFGNISIEYLLNTSGSMSLRVYNRYDNNNIFNELVNETGVGFTIKRKLLRLNHLFWFPKRRKKFLEKLPTESVGTTTKTSEKD